MHPPDVILTGLIYDDFHRNYRSFEHYQWQRRKESCQSKLLSSTQGLFAITRKPVKYALDCLEKSFAQTLQVIDHRKNLVQVPRPFPDAPILEWSLQNQPAAVKQTDEGYEVHSDLLLANGQTLACKTLIHEPAEIQARFAQLWSPRWNRHAEVSEGHWDQIIAFAEACLPRGRIVLPPLTISDWRKAVHTFKTTAATGPCGWSRADFIHMRDSHVQAVLDFFTALEDGAPWPQQWTVGLIHCLQKRDDNVTPDGFRPITVTSMYYRIYAGLRAGQILAQLAQWSDFMQCGFLRDRQASDVWYFVGICLEVSFQTNVPVHGLVADLVKAYNSLPRAPTFAFLRVLGLPPWFIRLWTSHLSVFTRYFVVRRCVGQGIQSHTGYPEGCPLACAAMTAVDVTWHMWQKCHEPRVLPMSYVDNLELICDRAPDLHASACQLDRFCQALDLAVDRSCLYVWSSSSFGRVSLKNLGYQISLGTRDLGGQVTYCRQLRNKVLTDRFAAVRPYFQKLRKANLPVGVKKLNIVQCLWPRALHGCEAVTVATGHFDKLRSGVMQALHWNHAGSSPLVRVTILHPSLDPEWYQLLHVAKLFRRQCRNNQVVLDWWRLFSATLAQRDTHGPFGKFLSQMQAIGLQVDEDCRLWFTEHGYINLLNCSDSVLELVLARYYQVSKGRQIADRAGFAGLQDGCDLGLTTSNDKNFSPKEQAQLMTARDGTFISDFEKAKFDTRIAAQCAGCRVPNTRLHKYTECSSFDSVRAGHITLFSEWDSYPPCFQMHGLVPLNPWLPLVWEALILLPSQLTDFQFEPQGTVLHCFTDGSVQAPHSVEDALASWAVVVAHEGPLAWGPLPGIQQTIPRAETFALLSVAHWIVGFTGTVHIWIDSQWVVDHAREILRRVFNAKETDHSDLWITIEDLFLSTNAEIHIHKVPSHDQECWSEGPVDDFARVWNTCVDLQAHAANMVRPKFFMDVWNKHQTYRKSWQRRVEQMTRFQVAIAEQDCARTPVDEEELDEEFVSFDFERVVNQAQVSVQLQPWLDNQTLFSNSFLDIQDHHFRSVSAQFLKWIITLDASASMKRNASLIELFVAFRLSRVDGLPVSPGGFGDYSVVTFASDFTYFKRVLRHVFGLANIPFGDKIALTFLRIMPPQDSVQLGWPSALEDEVYSALRTFIGNRPVTNSQSLARPWRPAH